MVQVKKPGQKPQVITLKAVAQHLGLTPGTVSAVLNDSPSARSIPPETKNRIRAAAKELNYRPNFFARTLRNKLLDPIPQRYQFRRGEQGKLVIASPGGRT